MKILSQNRFTVNTLRMMFSLVITCYVLSLLNACNIFEESEGAFLIVTSALPTTGGTVVKTGTGNVELLALPNENWSFSHWSGDVESTENPLQITLTKNTQVNANFTLSDNNNRVKLTVSDGQFISELQFGQVTGATDGFDTFIDLEAPPPPPDGVLFAWFEGVDRRLMFDYRNPLATSPVWNLSIKQGSRTEILLSWEIETPESSGTWILTNEDDAVQIDMKSVNTAELTIPELSRFEINYSN
ncbi:MAG: hypothetical protein JJU37_09865 [Balneolaceae bacterium]|nr:hypothetical protein [Balneolaceae bacterium]